MMNENMNKIFWNQPIGLILTVALTILVGNILNLESISTVGSASFLFIFALVNYTNYKLSDITKSKKYFSLIGMILCILALGTLLYQQFETNPIGIYTVLGITVSSYVVEYI